MFPPLLICRYIVANQCYGKKECAFGFDLDDTVYKFADTNETKAAGVFTASKSLCASPTGCTFSDGLNVTCPHRGATGANANWTHGSLEEVR